MTNTKDIIIQLKKVREEKQLSFGDILDLMEKNGDYLAKSTLSRVFADGSEECSFKYEETIRPIAKAMLDIEDIEDTDNLDVRAMKSLLKFKMQVIEDLEKQIFELKSQLDQEIIKHHEKLEKEREQSRSSIDFLKEQVALKDKRMDLLLEAIFQKDKQHKDLLDKLLKCQHCPNTED